MTNAEAWFNIALRPRKPEGSLGRTAQDGHLDSHTVPELCFYKHSCFLHLFWTFFLNGMVGAEDKGIVTITEWPMLLFEFILNSKLNNCYCIAFSAFCIIRVQICKVAVY